MTITRLETFMMLNPVQFMRKATGEKVLAIQSIYPWAFQDHQVGDFIIYDQSRHIGDQLYRCPPKRFAIIYELISH